MLVDIGANSGQYVRQMAPYYRKILAFEPQVDIAFQIVKDLDPLYRDRVSLVAGVALGSADGVRRIRVLRNQTCTTFLEDVRLIHPVLSSGYDQIREDEVKVSRLDNFLGLMTYYCPVVLKIDVEGWEAEVLRGASDVLRRLKPTVAVEVHSESLLDEVTGILAHEKYRVSEQITQPGGDYRQRWWIVAQRTYP